MLLSTSLMTLHVSHNDFIFFLIFGGMFTNAVNVHREYGFVALKKFGSLMIERCSGKKISVATTQCCW